MQLELHPLLTPSTPSSEVHLIWDMRWPAAQCRRSCDLHSDSWSDGRTHPATCPRVSSLRIVCDGLRWQCTVDASQPEKGVTCEDVIEALKLFDPNTVTNVAVDLYAGGYWEFWGSRRACKPLQGHDSFREQLEQALLRFPHPNVAVSFERPLHYSGGYMWYHHYFRA